MGLEEAFNNIPGETGQIVQKKLKDTLFKNEGFQKLKKIALQEKLIRTCKWPRIWLQNLNMRP